MGTPYFSVPILKSIYESEHIIKCVYTQPPKKMNRGQKEKFSPVYEFSKNMKLDIRHPENLNIEEEFQFIKNLKPDVVIVVAYGKILPSKILNIDNIKFINIHASLLPKWRGAAPIQRAIMNLDKETGISIMQIIPKLDAGPVMMKTKVSISQNSNYETLSQEMSNLGAKKIINALDLIKNNEAKFVPQIEEEASYAKKIDKKEAKINWHENADKVVGKINALFPNPGSWFEMNGTRIKIIKAIASKEKGTAGKIINKNFTIACGKDSIRILELQKEGKQKMKSIEFLKGYDLKVGSVIK